MSAFKTFWSASGVLPQNVRRRVGEHQTTTIDGVEARDGLINVEEYRKKCQTVAKERQIRSNTKSLWSGKFFHLKRRARKTTFWCRFSSSLHLRAKSQRAQHIICNIQTTFLNPAHRLLEPESIALLCENDVALASPGKGTGHAEPASWERLTKETGRKIITGNEERMNQLIWNSLPNELQEAGSVNCFKRLYLKLLSYPHSANALDLAINCPHY